MNSDDEIWRAQVLQALAGIEEQIATSNMLLDKVVNAVGVNSILQRVEHKMMHNFRGRIYAEALLKRWLAKSGRECAFFRGQDEAHGLIIGTFYRNDKNAQEFDRFCVLLRERMRVKRPVDVTAFGRWSWTAQGRYERNGEQNAKMPPFIWQIQSEVLALSPSDRKEADNLIIRVGTNAETAKKIEEETIGGVING